MKSKRRTRRVKRRRDSFCARPCVLSLSIRAALRRHAGFTSALTLSVMLSAGGSDKALARENHGLKSSVPIEQSILLDSGLVVIDPSVPNYRLLLSGVRPGVRTVVLDAERNGLSQLGELLKTNRGVRTVHLIAHGAPGALRLGNAWIRREELETHQSALSTWFAPGPTPPELLLYGCRVAEDDEGKVFVERLSALTGADVAASDDVTGSRLRGGDWVLEHASGPIESPLAFSSQALNAYPGVLATITVNTTDDQINDDGQCSLREAVISANTDASSGLIQGECAAGIGADTIILGADTYTLEITGSGEDDAATGDLDITSNITIRGAGQNLTIIDAGGSGLTPLGDRVLHVHSAANLTLEDTRVTGGTAVGSFPYNRGGGIFNEGTTKLYSSTVSGNSATYGGGISNYGYVTVTLSSSTVSGNNANESGGGIFNSYHGTATLNNSTVSGNGAGASGGGIYNSYYAAATLSNSTVSANGAGTDGGGIANYVDSNVTLRNSTVSGNSALNFGGGLFNDSVSTATLTHGTIAFNSASDGGGIRNSTNGEVTLRNSLIARNVRGNCKADGPITDDGNSRVDDASCGLTQSMQIRLGPLADNGGSTNTHALLAGSTAIDAVTGCVNSPATDQRGVARPQGSHCDIGAFEAKDSDRDGVADVNDAFPNNPNETLDSDGDGMGDNFENRFGLNPNVDDASGDPDGDGKTNLEEFLNGTHPRVNEGALINIINSILLDD